MDDLLFIYNTNNPYTILKERNIEIIKVPKNHKILSGKNCIYIAFLKSVYIRDDLTFGHELFYLRHEIGHIILHSNIYSGYILCCGKLEKEANYFAFKLSQIVFDELELLNMTLEQICCHYGLPLNAVKQIIHLICLLLVFLGFKYV